MNFKKACIYLATCALFFIDASACHARPAVGFNITNPFHRSEADRKRTLLALHKAGVHFIRTPVPLNEEGVKFIDECGKLGIKLLLVINLKDGLHPGSEIVKRSGSETQSWDRYRISTLSAEKLSGRFGAFIRKIPKSVLYGVEVGNEINLSSFNGDIPSEPRGRVYGGSWMNELEGEKFKRGLDLYISIVRKIRNVLNHDIDHKRTIILSAGLSVYEGDIGQGNARYPAIVDAASTAKYLDRAGMSSLVDGYAIHSYPWKDRPGDPSADASRSNRFLRFALEACNMPAFKSCWLTEWGFPHKPGECDAADLKLIASTDKFYESLSKKIRGIFYYTWDGEAWDSGPDQYSAQPCIRKDARVLGRYMGR